MIELSFGLVTIILCSACLLLHLFTLVTPYWMYTPTKKDEEYMTFLGLWQVCTTKEWRTGDVHVCQTPKYISDSMQWTRAMEIFGAMSLSAALTCGFLKQFVFKRQEKLLKAGCTCGFAAGALMLIGIFSLVGEVTSDGKVLSGLKFHASFGLCIVAALIAFAAGAIFFLWDRKDSVERVKMGQDSVGPITMGSINDGFS